MERSLEALAARAQQAGIFLDFDGTLSEIVRLPHDARPAEGVAEALTRLAETMKVVAVVSGRSAHQLLEWLGPHVEIWGIHGAERTVGGRVELSEAAAAHEERMRAVLAAAESAVQGSGREGIVVEDKGVVIGLHYRAAKDRGASSRWVKTLAQDLAERFGVTVSPGRMILELRAPIVFSKKAVVIERVREAELEAAAFVGDDVVDLPGFEALDELEDRLEATLRVAVDSDEAPPELLNSADLVVHGPRGVVELLNRLNDLAGGA